jgi:chromate transporter
MSVKSEDLFRKISFNFILGKPSFYLLVALFLGMWVYFSVRTEDDYIYVFGFYFVGCLIIGPIDTIFAYFLAVLLPFGHLSRAQIWVGIPIAFLLPGTHLNIGIYFGSMLDGVTGAILSAVFLYLPCFLSLFGILPQWKYYR